MGGNHLITVVLHDICEEGSQEWDIFLFKLNSFLYFFFEKNRQSKIRKDKENKEE